MKKIPAFRTGTHTDMNGKQLTFNREDGVCQGSCHPNLNQATKTSVGITRLDRRTGLSAVG